MSNEQEYYFIYSESERKMKEKIASKINKKYIPSKVRVSGVWKEVTSVLTESQFSNYKFSDAKKLLIGKMSQVTYQKGSEM